MRVIFTITALCGFLLSLGIAQVKRAPNLQPGVFELFAEQPNVHVSWSKDMGGIVSGETNALVTALSIEDGLPSPNRMRGIRIDLANGRAQDRVYIEEARLEAIKSALEEIENGIETFRKEPESAPYRYHGAAEFWHPHVRVHTLNAAYYIAPDSSGLSLSAYRDEEFRFPNHRPAELAELIGRALAELKQNRP